MTSKKRPVVSPALSAALAEQRAAHKAQVAKQMEAAPACDCCGRKAISAKVGTTHQGCTGLSPMLDAAVEKNPALAGRLKGQTKGVWR